MKTTVISKFTDNQIGIQPLNKSGFYILIT